MESLCREQLAVSKTTKGSLVNKWTLRFGTSISSIKFNSLNSKSCLWTKLSLRLLMLKDLYLQTIIYWLVSHNQIWQNFKYRKTWMDWCSSKDLKPIYSRVTIKEIDLQYHLLWPHQLAPIHTLFKKWRTESLVLTRVSSPTTLVLDLLRPHITWDLTQLAANNTTHL